MKAYQIHQGEALAVLRTMEPDSIDCCITSPPYFGLRSYGTDPVEWPEVRYSMFGAEVVVPAGLYSLGLEESPVQFVGHIVDVFREVRRVLKPTGTCWVNLGDSYAGSWGAQGRQGRGSLAGRSIVGARQIAAAAKKTHRTGVISKDSGLKPKDLMGVPWWCAFALQGDGWWLRSDIIWQKPAPMPSSCADRPTKAHEYIFLLAKSAKYYYNADAIREPSQSTDPRSHRDSRTFAGRVQRNSDLERYGTSRGRVNQSCIHPMGRNKRSVWTLAPQPSKDLHYAVYPIELPEICLLAGSQPGGVILDPFAGTATTILAAIKNGRRAIGIELSPAYVDLAHKRIARIMPLLAVNS